jgi:putative flippase GtrA
MKPALRDRRRLMIYVAVGATCFCLQFAVLATLVHASVNRPLANSAAFALSAQLNFLLSSKLTWSDRPAGGRRVIARRWAAYNCTALLSLGFDTAVFLVAYRAIGTTAAAAAGVLAAASLTYLACHTVIFRPAFGGGGGGR